VTALFGEEFVEAIQQRAAEFAGKAAKFAAFIS
jgi:hypothetical protein